MAVAQQSKALDLYLSTEGQVMGQERARREMAALLERQWQVYRGDLDYANGAIVAGRSGTGKSFSLRLMCQHLGIPFAEADATRYTESGYKGLDLQQMFIPLLESAARMKDAEHPLEASRFSHRAESEAVIRFSSEGALHLDQRPSGGGRETSVLKREDIDQVIERAQCGVILLDEFDKWMLRINHVTGEKDKAIQSELLKMVEGSTEYISDSDEEIGVQFDTKRVLIICAGAFVGLFQQVHQRFGGDSDDKSYMQQEHFWNAIVPEDFERFGLLPELAGRLSTHIFTRPLTVGNLRDILTREGGLLEEYRQRYEGYGCKWSVGQAAEIHIADLAIKRDTGARALEHVLWKMLGGEVVFQAATADYPCEVVLEPNMPRAEVRPLQPTR